MRSRSATFRGHLAAASLKHRFMKYQPTSLSPFRGHLAAASLKHVLALGLARVLGAFRGHLAAASLKPLPRERRHAARPPFPRPFGRGLIEAATAARVVGSSSPAFRGHLAAASLKLRSRDAPR